MSNRSMIGEARPPVIVVCADSADYLRTIADNTFHACVTDPPYGLGEPPDPADVLRQWADRGDWSPRKGGKLGGFMNCTWDLFVPGPALWREVYRVLKPGAYCAVFAAPRTWDWMSLSLRFAGFEVTDTLMWLFGQGFPKGGDVGKRIDAMLGAEREVVGSKLGRPGMAKDGSNQRSGWDAAFGQGGGRPLGSDITAAATPEAAAWDDCSTTLKPAWEPILLAQKPHGSTVARCCVEHGTGALRTGACRIGWASEADKEAGRPASFAQAHSGFDGQAFAIADRSQRDPVAEQPSAGRWPANVAFDEAAAEALDQQSGFRRPGEMPANRSDVGYHAGDQGTHGDRVVLDKGGGASRFFYCAKASQSDRDAGLSDDARNRHPTVKPEALMRWLTRLVTPPGGELLDPFGGSGSTGKAAALEGLHATIVEREPEHAAVAEARVADALRRTSHATPATPPAAPAEPAPPPTVVALGQIGMGW